MWLCAESLAGSRLGAFDDPRDPVTGKDCQDFVRVQILTSTCDVTRRHSVENAEPSATRYVAYGTFWTAADTSLQLAVDKLHGLLTALPQPPGCMCSSASILEHIT
jgi:hypothetical protein